MLAAGRGTRFGGDGPKALAPFAGRPLVAHAVAAALGSGLAPVVVVVSDDRVAAAAGPDVRVVRNTEPERGIASSLQAALQALADEAGVDGVVVGLADQPLVGAEAYRRVAGAAAAGARLAAATYGGRRANPVLVARAAWDDALALRGDEGARSLFGRLGVTEVPCDGTGDPADVDTPEALAALERAHTRARGGEH